MHRAKFNCGFRPQVSYCFELTEDSVLFSPPVYESLLVDEIQGAKLIKSDIDLLLNQNRLSSLGEDNVKKIFDSLASQSSSFDSLRSKISDSDLLKFCKSRYLQSPSELRAWSDYISKNLDSLVSDKVLSESSPETSPVTSPKTFAESSSES